MKRLPYSLKNLLAIWQQQEYDSLLFREWTRAEPRETALTHHIQGIQPERWTKKLRLIYRASQVLTFLLIPKPTAIILATRIFQPLEWLARHWLVWQASRALRQHQKNGLHVIAVAGSYGKTSAKHSLYHLLSSQFPTLMTPASYNTPLGIASTILHQLQPHHQCFIVELGEYKVGDLDELLKFIRPEIGVVTPIGYAHLERFKTKANLEKTFQEMENSEHAPKILLSDITNQKILTKKDIVWYGSTSSANIQLTNFTPALEGSPYEVSFDGHRVSGTTRLLGKHQLENALPGLWLLDHWEKDWKKAARSLAYHPAISRRLEAHRNPNHTWVIDNSYNSNPGSWKEIYRILTALKIDSLMVITAGFLELDAQTRQKTHQQLSDQLSQVATSVGLIPTRYNDDLRHQLQKHSHLSLIEGLTREEILQQIPNLSPRPQVIWLEGGVREMYQ